MRFSILGRTGRIRVARLKKAHGDCDHPEKPSAEIRIGAHLRGKKELEVLLHELGHFSDWHKDETYVRDVARGMADVLWRWGYRKQS